MASSKNYNVKKIGKRALLIKNIESHTGILKSHTPAAWCPLGWKIVSGIPGISINRSIPKAIPRSATFGRYGTRGHSALDPLSPLLCSQPHENDFEKKKSIGSEAFNFDGNHAEPYPSKVNHLTGIQKNLKAIRGS